MKIPFKFQEIETIDQSKFKAKFKAAIKKIKTKVNSPQTAVEVFINQEHEFSDGTGPLIIIGKLAGPWKKWAKDAIKKNKKMTMVGKGYVETDEKGNEQFTFQKLTGNAKINKFEKEAKQILRAAKLKLNQVENILTASPETEKSPEAEASDTSVEETQQDDNTNNDAQLLPQIKELMQGVATGFKDKIKGNVIPAIKSGQATSDHLNITNTIYSKLEELQGVVAQASDAFKAKIQSKVEKILQVEPHLQKIKAKLEELLGDDSTEEHSPTLTDEKREELRQERASIKSQVQELLAQLEAA